MRTIRRIFSAALVLTLITLSVCWGALLIEANLQLDTPFLWYGWVFPAATVGWAMGAHHVDSKRGHDRRVLAAKTPGGELGHGGLGDTEDLRKAGLLGGTGGILLGHDKASGEEIRFTSKDGHGMLVGATGSGKNRDFATAAVLSYPGSMIVIDPKGALCAITARHRATMGKVVVLNPFECDAEAFPPSMKIPKSARYNPMRCV